MITLLAQFCLRLSTALEEAGKCVAYGEEAAAHYKEPYTFVEGISDLASGFAFGWSKSSLSR